MKTVQPPDSKRFARMGLPWAAFALALSIAVFSCAQEVKITSPRYALVYGVQNYPNVSHLLYTLNDANAMSTLLARQGWTPTLGLDSTATRADIVADISHLASTVGSDAMVLLYFSGHGDLSNDGKTAIIAPYDTDFLKTAGNIIYINGIPQIDESTVISAPQLASMLAALPAKNIIIILDSCNSGGFITPSSAIDASPQNYSSMPYFSAFSTALSNFGSLLVANAAASGAKTPIVLSAAGTNESSYDGTVAMEHGVFTYYLLQAATNGDSNGDGVVTTTEAYVYTSAAIKSQWDANPYVTAFLPHISGGTRDLVLFVK
jgi:Caspase domain